MQGRLPVATRIIAVVKADGYGHGARRVGGAALEAGAFSLAVATLEEAAMLLTLCPRDRILILGGLLPQQASQAAALGCSVVVSTLEAAQALDAAVPSERLPVHLKVDTGMGRMGCRPEEAPSLARFVASSQHLRLAGTCTHFVASENDEVFTRAQFNRFNEVVAALGEDPGLRHVCNSGAALRYPEMGLDAVRLGIALYGCEAPSLLPALSLRSRILQVKSLQRGESVGYGRTWVAHEPTQVATVAIGYADGVHRLRSGRGWALVRGRQAPLLGRVSMDSLHLDVSGIEAAAGDAVTLIGSDGDRITAEQVAAWSETISYEVLTSIGHRVERRYLDAGGELEE